jgi:hypothetical protein
MNNDMDDELRTKAIGIAHYLGNLCARQITVHEYCYRVYNGDTIERRDTNIWDSIDYLLLLSSPKPVMENRHLDELDEWIESMKEKKHENIPYK